MRKSYLWISLGVLFTAGALNYVYQAQQKKYEFKRQAESIKNKIMKLQNQKTTDGLADQTDQVEYMIIRNRGHVEKFKSEIHGNMASTEKAGSSKLKYKLAKNLVLDMVSKGHSLKSQARFKKEAKGWRVQLLHDNTVFHKAGIQNNDLILFDDIKRIIDSNGERNTLTIRMKKLFDQLSE